MDKPNPPEDAFQYYLRYAEEAQGKILEPMCGTGRFLLPLLEKGYSVSGFDYSPHMLEICRKKWAAKGLKPILAEATFETFSSQGIYNLIFIPSSSFCLLIDPKLAIQALNFVSNKLTPKGKFVFEVETVAAVGQPQDSWKGKWVNRGDGSKIVLGIETTLCRYELWEKNHITQTEVEDFRLRLYEASEIEQLLAQENLKIIGRWQAEPYIRAEANNAGPVILYECTKN